MIIYIIGAYEYEGIFNEDGDLLGHWHENDAEWRDEYFNYIFSKLGIEIKRSNKRDLVKKLKKEVGY